MSESIFLFVPNIIGYARILLLLYACWFMTSGPSRAIVAYLLSALLDAFDGHAARLLDQCTKFGSMLDMLSDRCATMCLLFALGTFYPRYLFFFQISACIDIGSHWLHLYTSVESGSSSHKTISLDGNPLLRLYYSNRVVLFLMCAGNELFYAMLYLLHFGDGLSFLGLCLYRWILYVSCPIALMKTFISLVHLYTASINIAGIDALQRKNRPSQSVTLLEEKAE